VIIVALFELHSNRLDQPQLVQRSHDFSVDALVVGDSLGSLDVRRLHCSHDRRVSIRQLGEVKWLKGKVFSVWQSAQNEQEQAFTKFQTGASVLVTANDFASVLEEFRASRANLVGKVKSLYEKQITFCSAFDQKTRQEINAYLTLYVCIVAFEGACVRQEIVSFAYLSA
jgi:hypothetical protein